MGARVLVVAGLFSRAKHLEHVLGSASYEVAIATNEPDALACAGPGGCDVVILDARDPWPCSYHLCRSLATAPAPVLMITDERVPFQRLRAVDAGADECLCAPAPDWILLARVRSLVELKQLRDRARLAAAPGDRPDEPGIGADLPRILVCDPDARSRERLLAALADKYLVESSIDPSRAIQSVARGGIAAALIGAASGVIEQIALGRALCLASPSQPPRLLLLSDTDSFPSVPPEGGADDLIARPIDRTEAIVRVRTAVRKHRLASATHEPARPADIRSMGRPTGQWPPDRFAA